MYILYLSFQDDEEIQLKSEYTLMKGAFISFVLFTFSFFEDQTIFPDDPDIAITFARHKVANIIFIAVSADEFCVGIIN